MAASSTPLGYQCEFIDSVPEDFYCQQCSLVARRLTFTSCCGESYCNVCIHSAQQDSKPCPGCGQENFEMLQQVKYQKKILSLQVHCSMKERGCGWCGPLEVMNAHLDPDTGDCEYTDIQCPLKCECDKMINKKNLDHHLTNECVKRNPLACPNDCGVTCAKPAMEDHVKICRLQEVQCDFGCAEKFSREDEKEHMREKAQTHLTMMAATSVKMNQEFQTRLQEQEKISEAQERQFMESVQGLEKEFEEKLKTQEVILQTLFESFKNGTKRELAELKRMCGVSCQFAVENFSKEKAKNKVNDWESPPMYTHPGGYKFSIGIDANGCEISRGKSVNAYLWVSKGEYDDQLKWPVTAKFTLELINHFEGGQNKTCTITQSWDRPTRTYHKVEAFLTLPNKGFHFVSHSELPHNPATRTHFLKDDTLHFICTTEKMAQFSL